jgi:predicted HD superfamily hydrolase involved in NAD metabolism
MPVPWTASAEPYLRLIESRLPEKTLRHTLSVAETLVALSGPAGVQPDRAEAAGLLHDLCKPLKAPELLARAENDGLDIRPWHRRRPALLHGPVAAEECRRELGVDDEDVLEAIYWHTTGRPGLGRLGQALYVADFAEPLRPYTESAEARHVLEAEGFDAALRFVAHAKLRRVEARRAADPATRGFVEWLEDARPQ